MPRAAPGRQGTGCSRAGRSEDQVSAYRDAGYGQRLGFGTQPGLVVVDFVAAYLDPTSAMHAGVESVVAPAARVLGAARRAAIPVLFTRVSYPPGGPGGGLFARKMRPLEGFAEGSPLAEIIDELAPRDGEPVLTKQYASAFFGTTLDTTLRLAGVDTVILVGLSTSGCIRATAVDAIQLGFIPIVAADAVGDRDPRPHEQSLIDLDTKYADVVTSDEVIDHLDKLP